MDDDRIKEIGPNMACAEWLMKNGAQIRWKGCNEFVSHYNCLPHTQCGFLYQFKIEQVYAGKEASISHIGFRYFSTCTLYEYSASRPSKSFRAATDHTVFHVVPGIPGGFLPISTILKSRSITCSVFRSWCPPGRYSVVAL